ncbi:MAG: NmrA family NAD(P)-binding protein [Burkholderia contaminans]|uniref:NmrA family NAD(P)-binding protein n=1 Tax=Burkholderia contaminans TaxID=488447 RepID=A0AAP4VDU6_9BURK|nr:MULTISPECIES: NmrA family NAD(P)-binding protein [Burkholderia]MBD1413370.1 NmrA family NAD(P)-binding protein [Burkholderia contaminans]MBH9665990.1 NmrA family NAD(P)-binding protein [Burkholderia contaminans]MBH9674460.1 NmrA family NAD(P)-binding protein [Burkholderia contaminans]MBH9704506.1 NmrA family NAD(P)-binding protein [Burkholderia contaminans]MBH9719035.1 NmrA family NAD(P)-binding protein [Burkholderia contaminans]
MFVVTGVTGRTGAVAAQALINAGVAVRVVVRDRAKAARWAEQGAEVAVADLADSAALTRAFAGAHGAYLVKPPNYALENLFEHADVTARAVAEAVRAAGLPKLVLLSSVGADRPSGTGVIATNRTAEQRLAELGIPVVFLRAAYFMENWARVVEPVRTQGILPSLLVPIERAIPMVATEDIGRVAADLLREDWTGIRKIGLEGPAAYSPADIAAIFACALDRPVRPMALAPSEWAGVLAMNPFSSAAINGFIGLNHGLNSGHIDFGSDDTVERRQGRVTFEQVAEEILRA